MLVLKSLPQFFVSAADVTRKRVSADGLVLREVTGNSLNRWTQRSSNWLAARIWQRDSATGATRADSDQNGSDNGQPNESCHQSVSSSMILFSVGLCLVLAFFVFSGTARVGGTVPICSRAAALTAFVALNLAGLFFGAIGECAVTIVQYLTFIDKAGAGCRGIPR